MIKCGVPQGSILGPVLLFIYINYITKSSNILNLLLFADDTCLSFNETEQLLNQEMQKISIWLATSKLTLNLDKSNYLKWKACEKTLIFLNFIKIAKHTYSYAKFIVNSISENRFYLSFLKHEIFAFSITW